MAQDSFTTLNPVGTLRDVGVSPPQNGLGTYGPVIVTERLPGGRIQASGSGRQPLAAGTFLAQRGSISVRYKAGPGGAEMALVSLSNDVSVLGFKVDTFNRVFAILEDIDGAIVGESDPLGPTVLNGQVVTATLSWDSQAVIPNAEGLYAKFTVNNVVRVSAGWSATLPSSSWTSFAPTSLMLGMNLVSPGEDFDGVVQKVQVSDLII